MENVTLDQLQHQICTFAKRHTLGAEKLASVGTVMSGIGSGLKMDAAALLALGLGVGVPTGAMAGFLNQQRKSLGSDADLQEARTEYYNRMANKLNMKLQYAKEQQGAG